MSSCLGSVLLVLVTVQMVSTISVGDADRGVSEFVVEFDLSHVNLNAAYFGIAVDSEGHWDSYLGHALPWGWGPFPTGGDATPPVDGDTCETVTPIFPTCEGLQGGRSRGTGYRLGYVGAAARLGGPAFDAETTMLFSNAGIGEHDSVTVSCVLGPTGVVHAQFFCFQKTSPVQGRSWTMSGAQHGALTGPLEHFVIQEPLPLPAALAA